LSVSITSIARRRGVRQFVKFGAVGASGTLVNLCVFAALQRAVPGASSALHYGATYSIAFLGGGISNYYLNRIWTFASKGSTAREALQFLTVSVVALALGLGAASLAGPLVGGTVRGMWLISTGSGILVNFFANKYWTFRNAG
jgi:putative flippase GtrA